MSDAIGVAEAMLGLDGFRVLAVTETAAELVIRVETTAGLVGCPACGAVAVAHERMEPLILPVRSSRLGRRAVGTRYSTFKAAWSLGKWPRWPTARRNRAFNDSMALVGSRGGPPVHDGGGLVMSSMSMATLQDSSPAALARRM